MFRYFAEVCFLVLVWFCLVFLYYMTIHIQFCSAALVSRHYQQGYLDGNHSGATLSCLPLVGSKPVQHTAIQCGLPAGLEGGQGDTVLHASGLLPLEEYFIGRHLLISSH